ncbi:hypothetical protein [Marinobacterium weihaiense]|uniref:VanZ like family protein n=1 Tax=Marinobacterium weihaiense TaxID=2851016 RepID=A0ABS6M7Q7_9GAMM|nr:hypothetical protein [Marinobacterium weihaiense]MBV0932315.1 hypothetical protein [Marinobacterium weihaiense]
MMVPLWTRASRRFWRHYREEDKRQHFGYSFVLLLLAAPWVPLAAAVTLVLLIGLLKEIWDHFWGSGFCWIDMAANVLGIIGALPGAWLLASLWQSLVA